MTGEPLRFGIVSGDPSAAPTLARVCDALAARIARPVVPQVFPSFTELREDLAAERLALAWSPPIPAVELELEGRVSFLAAVHREGGSSYSSAIFTTTTSPVRTVEAIRGARVAWVSRDSAAGYLFPRLKLGALGLRGDAFGSESFEGTHEAVVRAVVEGRADVGATHVSFAPVRGNIESAGWTRAGVRDVRILATAGPIPPDVVVASRAAPASLLEPSTDALLALATHEATRDDVHALFAGRGFVLVGRYQYDALRALVATERASRDAPR